MSKKLSWTPVRRGSIYCAPACGCDCTYAAFRAATKAAEKLARLLPGFKPNVSENLGWWWDVKCAGVQLSLSRDRRYRATFDCMIWVNADTPQEALRALANAHRRKAEMAQKEAAIIEAICRKACRGEEALNLLIATPND